MKEILITYITTANLKEIMVDICWLLSLLGIAIDFTPWIKINPIRWCLGQLGKLLTGELSGKIDQLEEEVRQNRFDQDQNRIKDLRLRILDFSNSLAKRERDIEEFEEIFDADEEYLNLLKKYGLKNGRTDRAIRNIKKHYEKLIEDNL